VAQSVPVALLLHAILRPRLGGVCHCILSEVSVPPCFSALVWSMIYPGQVPADEPVAGHGCNSLNTRRALALRLIRPPGVRSQVWQYLEVPRLANIRFFFAYTVLVGQHLIMVAIWAGWEFCRCTRGCEPDGEHPF
jgi:hypothetical protein